jgi:hypothetical protein
MSGDVNSQNAVMQERARIREELIAKRQSTFTLSELLKIIRGDVF